MPKKIFNETEADLNKFENNRRTRAGSCVYHLIKKIHQAKRKSGGF
jgi:hypothetical protein